MAKEDVRTWKNVPFKTWKYEGQTEKKHDVLSYYMTLWFQVLGTWNKNIVYIDGFGGIGAYHTEKDISGGEYISEKYGSPVISAIIIDELKKVRKIDKAHVLIIDKEQKNIENIQRVLGYKGIDASNVHFIRGDFDEEINKFLDKYGTNLAPTFFMIDPFGFAQIKLSTIKRIMSYKSTEVFLNFMYNAIQRWTTLPILEARYNDLFGGKDWQKYTDKKTIEKEFALVNLFRKQCKEFAKFVYPYCMQFPDQDRSYYYLFHLSNHYKGCSLMKEAFSACNQGKVKYLGNKPPDLFDSLPSHESLDRCMSCYCGERKHNSDKCRQCISLKFSKRSISYKELMEETIDELPFIEGDIKKILQTMEKEKAIKVEAGKSRKGKRRSGFEDDDSIIFPNEI